jgi:hypothetical protein
VCARHGTDLAGWESLRQVFVEPKDRRRTRASSRDGVWRKSNPKARGDEQEPDMRCGTPGTSGHVTMKSSIHVGVCFINPALTRDKDLCLTLGDLLCALGSRVREKLAEHRVIGVDRIGEVSRGHISRRKRATQGRGGLTR